MASLLDLQDANAEQLKNLRPYSGLRAIEIVKDNPDTKFKLLHVKPKYQKTVYEGRENERIGFVFSAGKTQVFLKFGYIIDFKELKENDEFDYEIRTYNGNEYVVAV